MRKAQILDTLIPILVVFAMAVTGIVLAQIFSEIRDANVFTNQAQTTINNQLSFYSGLDTGLIIAYVGLVLVAIITAFLIDVHPIFAVIQVLVMILLLIFPAIIQEVYTSFTNLDSLSEGVAFFPKTTLLMSNLLIVYVSTFLVWGLALFLKFGGRGNQFSF